MKPLVSILFALGSMLLACEQTSLARAADLATITPEEAERLGPQYLVISPGPGTPQEAGCSIQMIRHFAGKIPVLGVCLGHQAVGAAFGAKIVQADRLMHGKPSDILHDSRTLFSSLPPVFPAVRYHSLIVDP